MTDVFHKIPVKKVKIGSISYTFELMHEKEEATRKLWGEAVAGDQKIRLAPGQSLERMVITLVHEITHCVHWYYGLNDESEEEAFTHLGTNGLIAVWRDNPVLFDWIHKSIRSLT